MQRVFQLFFVLLITCLFTACWETRLPAKVTGGGSFGHATFGFNADSCSPSGTLHGQFQYTVPGFGRFHGEVLGVTLGGSPCLDEEVKIELDYRSKDGSGEAIACLYDGEEDRAAIWVISGPYAGYSNSGPVRGKIKVHPC